MSDTAACAADGLSTTPSKVVVDVEVQHCQSGGDADQYAPAPLLGHDIDPARGRGGNVLGAGRSGEVGGLTSHMDAREVGEGVDDYGRAGADEDEEGEEEQEEEEEEEPMLKYQRIGASLPSILQSDSARCIKTHEKFLVLATHNGVVHVLDLNGNEILKLDLHSAPINDIALDLSGDYVATCANDGTVIVTNLFTKEQSKYTFSRPVKAVALPPNYPVLQTFATGGLNQQFILNSNGWFGHKQNIIHQGEGPIHAIAWQGDLVAWANEAGVKVFDHTTNERISHISRQKGSPSSDLYRCHLHWASADTLLIGWADSVKIGQVKQKRTVPVGVKVPGNTFIQIVAMFQTDYYICGIAPFQRNLVILAYIEDDEVPQPAIAASVPAGPATAPAAASSSSASCASSATAGVPQRQAQRPELRVVSYTNQDLSSDALPIHGYQHYKPTDYRLEYLPGYEPLFFIVSPKDVVLARPRDIDDRLTWLVSRGKFREALETASCNKDQLKQPNQLYDIGEKYLRHLVEVRDFKTAAEACPKLLDGKADLWESWILLFVREKQTRALSAVVPVESPVLSSRTYEMLLSCFLAEDPVLFLEMVRKWSPAVYSVDSVIQAVIYRLNDVRCKLLQGQGHGQGQGHVGKDSLAGVSKDATAGSTSSTLSLVGATNNSTVAVNSNAEVRVLMEALGELYILNKQNNEALQIYLETSRSDTFALISRLNLIGSVKDKVLALCLFNAEEAITLLVNSVHVIPAAKVVDQLKGYPFLQHSYLHALFQRDPNAGAKFHEIQLHLYAEYAPEYLLRFLRASKGYLLETALQICEKKNLYAEMVYVMKRMGHTNYALGLIIDKLQDVNEALSFVEEHRDDQLWEEVISKSLYNSQFLSELLEQAGGRRSSSVIDVAKLITRIPTSLEIPKLKEKLCIILTDHQLQVSLRKGCNKILQNDLLDLQEKLHKRQKTCMRVTDVQVCGICGVLILNGRAGTGPGAGAPPAAAAAAAGPTASPSFPPSMTGSASAGSVSVFHCRHVFHTPCLEAQQEHGQAKNCVLCGTRGSAKGHKSHVSALPSQSLREVGALSQRSDFVRDVATSGFLNSSAASSSTLSTSGGSSLLSTRSSMNAAAAAAVLGGRY